MGSMHQPDWLRDLNPCHSEDLFLRNCLTAREVGLWAAGLMGLTGDEATDYAHTLVSDFVKPGPLDIVQKLQADFRAKGIEISDHRIAVTIEHHQDTARRQIAGRVWSKTPGDGGWERRIFPRIVVPPLVLPQCIRDWLQRHQGTGAFTFKG